MKVHMSIKRRLFIIVLGVSFTCIAMEENVPMKERPEADRRASLQDVLYQAEHGKPEEYYNAGRMSETLGDYVLARKCYTLAINGHTQWEYDAIINLAILLQKGLGGAKDVDQALIYYEQAAKKNNPIALYNLGIISLESGDYQKARKLLEKAQFLSRNGTQYAKVYWNSGVTLGLMNERGFGIDKPSYFKASEEYKVSGLRGRLHYEQLVWTNKIDGDKAVAKEIFKNVACTYGDIVATFMYSAILIAEGQEEEGVKILQEAYSKNKNMLSMSMLQLGIAYWYGAGIERDQAKALDLFEKINKNENAEALVAQGYLYLKGLGVEQDIDKGLALIDESKNKITMNYLDPEVLFPDIREMREHRAETMRQALLAEEEGQKKSKKGKGKARPAISTVSTPSSSSSSSSSLGSTSEYSAATRIPDIFDITPEKWNKLWEVEDGSEVSRVDRSKKVIVINDPKEKEELIVTVQDKPYRMFADVRQLKEDPRIKQRQLEGTEQERHSHSFAQMLNYVIQCAGSLVPWVKDGSSEVKDSLITHVTRVDIQSRKETDCTAEYTFYKNKKSGKNPTDILYHRLLRPEWQK